MTRDLAIFAIVIIAVLLAVVISTEHRPSGYAMPLVQADAAPCPKLANPCDEIDCLYEPSRSKEIA